MDQPPLASPCDRPLAVSNIPARCAGAHPSGPLILRVACSEDVALAAAVAPERVVWVEVPLHFAQGRWPAGMPLDVIVDEPAAEAARLHALSRLRHDRPLRVTISIAPGAARAGRVAMALQLPVRLLPRQPSTAALAELHQLLDIYLYDARTEAPVEFFHSALAHWLHGNPATLWQALEQDPADFPRFGSGPEDVALDAPPRDPAFAADWIAQLVNEGGECASCRFRGVCGGYLKWPDVSYACASVLPLFARLESAARQLARDLSESDAIEP